MKKIVKVSDKALEFINQKHIKPIPRWKFLVKNWGIWFILILCLAFFVLGAGLSWFSLADGLVLPYFWLFVLAIFLTFSFFVFEKTKKAYRYQKRLVVFFLLVLGLTIGGLLFKTGLANRLDRDLERSIPGYRHLVPMKLENWNSPNQGRLSGKVLELDKNSFKLQDFYGKIWFITLDNTLVKGRINIEKDVEIKLIGTRTGESSFVAQEIKPWGGKKIE